MAYTYDQDEKEGFWLRKLGEWDTAENETGALSPQLY